MPWVRKKVSCGGGGTLCIALTAAVAAGILSCLLGAVLHERGSAMSAKYSRYKDLRSLIGSRSPAEIRAAMERRGIKAP